MNSISFSLNAFAAKQCRRAVHGLAVAVALLVAGTVHGDDHNGSDPELAYAAASNQPAVEIRGHACVVDGDTLAFGGETRNGRCIGGRIVHLDGIDAPELAQTCRDGFYVTIACGRYARSHLIVMTRQRLVRCLARPSKRQGHHRGTCFTTGTNLNTMMINAGMALAAPGASGAMASAERRARTGRNGIWQMRFTAPWMWRRTHT